MTLKNYIAEPNTKETLIKELSQITKNLCGIKPATLSAVVILNPAYEEEISKKTLKIAPNVCLIDTKDWLAIPNIIIFSLEVPRGQFKTITDYLPIK